jgi:CheY-like chemotaxis protein
VETPQIKAKVLVLGTNPLVRDNARVLLRSMGYHCVVASTLKEALALTQLEKPDAAILDPTFPDSPPARVVAMFYKRVPDLRGRSIVLVREESNPELLQVLDAYTLPRIRLEDLLRDLWPCLDSRLRRVVLPQQVTRGAPLIFDSFLELSCAGIRSLEPSCRQLRYETDTLVADLSLERERDSRISLTGQLLDTARKKPQLGSVPIVIQGHAGLIGVVKTNEWGEFHSEFEPQPGVSLEIRARENFWVSADLPDLNNAVRRGQESQVSLNRRGVGGLRNTCQEKERG